MSLNVLRVSKESQNSKRIEFPAIFLVTRNMCAHAESFVPKGENSNLSMRENSSTPTEGIDQKSEGCVCVRCETKADYLFPSETKVSSCKGSNSPSSPAPYLVHFFPTLFDTRDTSVMLFQYRNIIISGVLSRFSESAE